MWLQVKALSGLNGMRHWLAGNNDCMVLGSVQFPYVPTSLLIFYMISQLIK